MRDPYLYSDCDVLINKLGIKDAPLLDIAEVELSCNAIAELAETPLPGNYDFGHLCEMHRHIFQDLYDWAGVPRTVPIEKAEDILGYMSIQYAQPDAIGHEAESVLARMNGREWGSMDISEQAKALAQDMADLWKVHCFREGNTRTTVTFVCQFADAHGMPIDRELLKRNAAYTRKALVAASAVFQDADFRKPEYLIRIIRDGLERGASQRKREEPAEDKTRTLDEWDKRISDRQKAAESNTDVSPQKGRGKEKEK